MTLNNLVLFS